MAAPGTRPTGIINLTGRDFVLCVVSLYTGTCRTLTSKLNEVKLKEIIIVLVGAMNNVRGVLAPLILNVGTDCE
jgi:hypothetical protein